MTQKNKIHTDLTQGAIQGHLFRMASPMVLGILAIMTMYLADTYYLGQLGKEPLAAMGFIFPIISLFNGIAFGLGAGVSSVISRAIGRKDYSRVQQYASQAISLGFLIALVFALLGYFTIPPVFRLMGADANMIALISDYLTVWYSGCFLIVVPMIGNSAIRASGNSHIPGLVMIIVAVVNILLDPILIFGLFGFPKMALQGAALATIIAYSVSFCVALYILKLKLKILVWRYCIHNVIPGWKAILGIGIPAISNNLITPLSTAIITALVAQHGIEAVAGFNVAARLEAFFIIPLMAMASAMGPFFGQNLGANKIDRLQYGARYGFTFACLWGLVSAIVLMALANWITTFFSDDPHVIKTAHRYLTVVPWSYGLLGCIMLAASCATGMGSAIPALNLTLLRLVIIYMPIAYFASKNWGINGIFYAACAANLITGVIAITWLHRKFKREFEPPNRTSVS